MQEHRTPSSPESWTRHPAARLAGIVALTLLGAVVLPVVPIVLGVFLIGAVALHAWSPDLRPIVQPLLRVPVAGAGKRHARLLVAASVGVLLVLSGSVGATMRGRLRSEWEQREGELVAAEATAIEILARARHKLSAGDVEGAELELMEADAIVAIDSERQAEVSDLLERVLRSGDADAILDILTGLSPAEFEALQHGGSVPAALQFPERALTYRAVDLALALLDEARHRRARR